MTQDTPPTTTDAPGLVEELTAALTPPHHSVRNAKALEIAARYEARHEAEIAVLRDALRKMVHLVDSLGPEVDWGRSWLSAPTIQMLNEYPAAARALLKEKESDV